MIKFKAKATIGIKNANSLAVERVVIYDKEEKDLSAIFDAEKAIRNHLYQKAWQYGNNPPLPISRVPGAKGELLVALSWECTMNGRAAARPKAVIAAEKAAQALRGQAKREREEKWKKEAAQRIVNLRNRIKQQVDHAFALGKHGTEPAGKYITCQHCDAPAAVLSLLNAPARGSSVLDEDTIIGACCADHRSNAPYSYYNRYGRSTPATVLECSKLEFFYDGIRQIAIKP